MALFGKKRTESEAERIYAEVERERDDAALAHEEAKAAAIAATLALEAAEVREFRAEGEVQFSRVPPEQLEAARIARADAKLAVSRTAAAVRHAERRDLAAQYAAETHKPEYVRARVRDHVTRHAEIASRFLAKLEEAAAINGELHASHAQASTEFPAFDLAYYEAQRQGRKATRAYPVNAGLTDLSWVEFRHNPHAANGGRLGTFRKRVEAFLREAEGILKAGEGRMSRTPQPWTGSDERCHVSTPIERLKTSAKAGAMTFEGYASVFGTLIDAYVPTVIEPGAFAATLADPDQRRRMRLLYGHNTEQVIGRLTDLHEDRRGLFIKGAISDTALGREVYTLLKDGALDEMSIGFDPVEYWMAREPDQAEDVRHLTAVHLWEVSVVSFAANRDARVASVHRRAARPRYRPDIAAHLRELDLLCLEQGLILPDER